MISKEEQTWGLFGEEVSHKITTYSDYDGLGFAQKIVKRITDTDGEVFTEQTDTQYQNDTGRWLIGKPVAVQVTKQQANSVISRKTAFEYAAETGALTQQTIEPGQALSLSQAFSYNTKGLRISEQSTASGQTRGSSTEYDAAGRIIKHINALGHSVTTQYDNVCGLPSAATDVNGLTTTFSYDGFCREVKKTLPDGNWVAQVYEWSDGADAGLDQYGLTLGDRSRFMVTRQTSQGELSSAYFDIMGREVRSKTLNGDGKNIIIDKAYNANGQLAGETVPYIEGLFAGDATYWQRTDYDAIGRPTRKVQPSEQDGDLVADIYYQGLAVTIEGPGNYNKTELSNGLGQTVRVTENNQSVVSYQYDAYGNLTQTNANGQITALEYDLFGNKSKMVDPAMGTWTYGYNGWGELIWQQDAKQQRSTFSYDALGRKLTEIRPDSSNQWQYDQSVKGALDKASGDKVERQYTYDQLGRATSMTLALDGNTYTTRYQYNQDGRLSQVTFPSGLRLDKSYDINGLIKRMSIPNSDIWDSEYLQLEEALKETAARIVELEMQAYQLEQNAQYYIEEFERLRQAAEQLFAQSKQFESRADRLYADARSLYRSANININRANSYRKTAHYYWTVFGNNVFKYYETQNGTAYYKFDKCVKKNRKGCKKREYFTAAVPTWMVETRKCLTGKLKGLCYNGPKSSINLTQVYNQWADHYQAIANQQRSQARQKQSQANYYQNLANNTEQRAQDMLDQAQQYASLAREQTDLLAGLTDELDDLVVAEAELQEILDQRLSDDTAEIVWLATSRDNFGRISGELFGNGLLTRRETDRARGTINRITTGMGGHYLRDLRYTYDARSNVLSKTSQIREQEEHYQYDDFDRLTGWNYRDNKTIAYAERDYCYDIYGNMIYKTGVGEFDVNPNGQLNGGYRYDANGNMLEGRGRSINWNSFNKASQINDNGTVIAYDYGTERERVKQTADGKTIYYISPEYQLEQSTNTKGQSVTTMRHRFKADGQAVAEHIKTVIDGEKQIDKTAYLHRDALGSADLITDPNGQVQLERSYTPFGESLAAAEIQTTPLFMNAEMRGFTGHENVGGGSGLINMNARLYDPVIGRFLSADSFVQDPGLSQSHNRYAYVLNNPMKYTDPSGHFWNAIIGLVIMIISQTFEDSAVQTIGMIVGSIFTAGGTSSLFSSALEGASLAVASGATTSFASTYIMSGDLGNAVEGAILGGMSAAATWQVGHGVGQNWSSGEQAIGHGIAQGGFNELRGGSFKQGFISGVIGKAGGSVIHDGDSTISLQEMGGMIVISGIAASASGASSKDAIMRSAISVITVYLYNENGVNTVKLKGERRVLKNGQSVIKLRKVEGPTYSSAINIDDVSKLFGFFNKLKYIGIEVELNPYMHFELWEETETEMTIYVQYEGLSDYSEEVLSVGEVVPTLAAPYWRQLDYSENTYWKVDGVNICIIACPPK